MLESPQSLTEPNFDAPGGLIPVITQDYMTGEVLMQAWMNRTAWKLTLEHKSAVYWSRSRGCLWEKGEISGNKQIVKEIYLDCDRDCVLLKVEQMGDAACHTGRRSCFFQQVNEGKIKIISEPLFNPADVYGIDS